MNGSCTISVSYTHLQSRLCMFFLRKAHIGEVQVSIWPEDMIKECSENNIFLL